MATGTVKWFSDEKGFGFITPDEAGKDLFVHHSGIEGGGFKTLAEGASVSYDTQAGDKGPKAVNVQATSSLASQERTKPRARRPGVEGVELRRTADGKGDGVLATRPFAAGETVMVGFLVGPLRANDSHATQVGPGRWALHGGLGPKVNHSCDPNCGVRLNDGQAFDFVARQPIGAGQELTFDYAMRNFTIEHFPAVCLCGAAQCRGSITGWKDLPAARKQDYGELVAPYLRQMDDETPRGLGSASAGPP